MPRHVKPLAWLIFIYILVSVGRVHQHFSFLSPLRPALLTFFLICGYVVLVPRALDLSILWRTWPGKAIVLLGSIAIISAPFGISLGASGMFMIQDFAAIILFAAIMVSAVGTLAVTRMVMAAFVVSAGFWLYLSYFVLGASLQGATSGILRLDFGYTYDANDICVIFAAALPLALLFFRTANRKWARRGALLVAFGIPGAVAMSGSRGGLLGLIAAFIPLMILVKEVSVIQKAGGVFVLVLGLMIAAPPGYWQQMETILSPKEDYNWSDPTGRRQIFLRGLGYIASRPVFGLGINNFARAEGTIGPMARNHVAGTGLRFVAPHNTPLQIAAEMGVPALLIWLSIPFIGVFVLPRHRRRLAHNSEDPDERFLYHACTYLPAMWTGFLVSSVFVSFAYLSPYYILVAYTGGVMMGLARHEGVLPVALPRRVVLSEHRSRRPVMPTPAWQPPRRLASGSAASEPGEGFAHEG